MGYAFQNFLYEILKADTSLSEATPHELENFLCQSFIDSVQEASEMLWLASSESAGKEENIRSFIRQNLVIPSSCHFF